MPLSVYYDCAHRHMEAWWADKDDEDHAAAVVWNMLCAMWTEANLKGDVKKPLEALDDKWKHPHK